MSQKMTADLRSFRDSIRRQGLKHTRQREDIFVYLLRSGKHVRPEDIYVAMRRNEPTLGRATVFRTLKVLERCGLVSHVRDAQGHMRYEAAEGRAHHDHMICVSCGDTLEFSNSLIERTQDAVARQAGFRILWHRHEIFGTCRRCAARRAAKGKT